MSQERAWRRVRREQERQLQRIASQDIQEEHRKILNQRKFNGYRGFETPHHEEARRSSYRFPLD